MTKRSARKSPGISAARRSNKADWIEFRSWQSHFGPEVGEELTCLCRQSKVVQVQGSLYGIGKGQARAGYTLKERVGPLQWPNNEDRRFVVVFNPPQRGIELLHEIQIHGIPRCVQQKIESRRPVQVEVGVPVARCCYTAHGHLGRLHPFESSQESLGIGFLPRDITVTEGSSPAPGKGEQFIPGTFRKPGKLDGTVRISNDVPPLFEFLHCLSHRRVAASDLFRQLADGNRSFSQQPAVKQYL